VFSVSFLGVKTLSRLTHDGPRPPPGPAYEDRVYKILAFLGAWWAALIHWFMDVSIRFVSSGIYSFLLPALVVGIVRNDPSPSQQDKPSRLDHWVRLGAAGFWMAFFLWARMEPSLVLFAGSCLIAIGELLEARLSDSPRSLSPTPFLAGAFLAFAAEAIDLGGLSRGEQPVLHLIRILAALGLFFVGWVIMKAEKPSLESSPGNEGPPPSWFQFPVAALLVGVWLAGLFVWRGYFLADVSHNVAIFFSKQRIWMKSPEFDGQVKSAGFPSNMRDEYEKVGGALEHYEQTARLNPAFPMANYFVGNVHSDWGSGIFDRAREALARGDAAGAETLRAQAEEQWRLSLKTYDEVKAFAPNYVQTHHQVGLLYIKLAEMEKTWGRVDKANEYWDTALVHLKLYQNLDPVFPGNYYRQAYVHFMREDFDKAEEAYLGALVYNSTNVVNRVYQDRNAETYSSLARMHYVRLVNQFPQGNLPADSALFRKAEHFFLKALEAAALSGREDEVGLEPAKSLAVLYGRAGLMQKAQEVWLKIRQWNPRDPDVQKVFSPPPRPG
jgi:tetratricopeptide (TPR) repeat protein